MPRLQKLTTNSETSASIITSERAVLIEQVQQYEKLIGQYQLMADSKSPVLIVVEKARASTWPDKPKKVLLLTATFVLSLVFALLIGFIA